MAAHERVVRGVSGSPNLAEQLSNLARKDALVLQASQQIVLRFLARRIHADPCRHELRKQLGHLAQLQEGAVRIVGKIARRQHSQAHELGVMNLEVGEVRARGTALTSHPRLKSAGPCNRATTFQPELGIDPGVLPPVVPGDRNSMRARG